MFVKSEWTDYTSAKIIADMMDGFVESNSDGKYRAIYEIFFRCCMKELYEILICVYDAKKCLEENHAPVDEYILNYFTEMMKEDCAKLGIDYRPYYDLLGEKAPREVLTLLMKKSV